MIADRVSELLGRRIVSLERIESRGYAAAYHAVAELEDGLSVFVKTGTEEVTSQFLRDEIRFYRSFQAPFMPVFHGADDGEPPILVIEDLREGRWPPPWDSDAVNTVRQALETLAASAARMARARRSRVADRRLGRDRARPRAVSLDRHVLPPVARSFAARPSRCRRDRSRRR